MLDKNYFHFLKKLVFLEEDEENEEIREEFTKLTPEERELRGKALLGLLLAEKYFSPADHRLATFSRPYQKPLPLFSLETGDVVSLFPENLNNVTFPTGTVYEKTTTTITVAFNKTLPDWLEKDLTYQLHKSLNRVTYKRMIEALDAVYETRNTRLADFRDISLKEKSPAFEALNVKEILWQDKGLNASQKEAVQKALSAKDIMLVHGPPGTGKTTVLVEIICQSVMRKQAIFVTAPSNTACDNVLECLIKKGLNVIRLGHPARIAIPLREHTLDFKLALHPLSQEISDRQSHLNRLFKREDRYRERRSPGRDAERRIRNEIEELKDDIRRLRKEIFSCVMKGAEVIIGTPTGIQDKSIREKVFDVLIIDEATQATEPLTWIPMTRAKKVIMAGDHFQLPPTVRSKEAEEQGLGVTLFERFHEVLNDDFRQLLERQYRMNEKIMGFSSLEFYKNLLVADESVKSQTLSGLRGVKECVETIEPLIFIDTAGKGFEEKLEEGSESRYNPEEAQLVLEQLRKMLDLGVPSKEIAVISPYSAQVRFIVSQVAACLSAPACPCLPAGRAVGRGRDSEIEIDSVDGFQGREKELVIVTLVRANMEGEMGFLADTRRMNVAMTRARRKLIVIGDSATLSSIKFYADFIKYAESIGG
ncbi:MAG: hypothetical protein AUJ72_00200, partial [Candidatus Omnitrophica bacterium CG1_02_46_14]